MNYREFQARTVVTLLGAPWRFHLQLQQKQCIEALESQSSVFIRDEDL